MDVILEGVVGSTAYGLATPDSDVDTLGVFMAPTRDLLGLTRPKESIVHHDPDSAHHELGKFVALCLKANPTVMELLWLNSWTVRRWEAEPLIENRHRFLSQRVRKTYGGYVKSQIKRLEGRGDGSFASDLRKRTEKHGRHCWRLTLQGESLLTTGELRVRLRDDEVAEARAMGALAASKPGKFVTHVKRRIAIMDALPTDLPEEPDFEWANEFLIEARLSPVRR